MAILYSASIKEIKDADLTGTKINTGIQRLSYYFDNCLNGRRNADFFKQPIGN